MNVRKSPAIMATDDDAFAWEAYPLLFSGHIDLQRSLLHVLRTLAADVAARVDFAYSERSVAANDACRGVCDLLRELQTAKLENERVKRDFGVSESSLTAAIDDEAPNTAEIESFRLWFAKISPVVGFDARRQSMLGVGSHAGDLAALLDELLTCRQQAASLKRTLDSRHRVLDLQVDCQGQAQAAIKAQRRALALASVPLAHAQRFTHHKEIATRTERLKEELARLAERSARRIVRSELVSLEAAERGRVDELARIGEAASATARQCVIEGERAWEDGLQRLEKLRAEGDAAISSAKMSCAAAAARVEALAQSVHFVETRRDVRALWHTFHQDRDIPSMQTEFHLACLIKHPYSIWAERKLRGALALIRVQRTNLVQAVERPLVQGLQPMQALPVARAPVNSRIQLARRSAAATTPVRPRSPPVIATGTRVRLGSHHPSGASGGGLAGAMRAIQLAKRNANGIGLPSSRSQAHMARTEEEAREKPDGVDTLSMIDVAETGKYTTGASLDRIRCVALNADLINSFAGESATLKHSLGSTDDSFLGANGHVLQPFRPAQFELSHAIITPIRTTESGNAHSNHSGKTKVRFDETLMVHAVEARGTDSNREHGIMEESVARETGLAVQSLRAPLP